MFFEAAPSNTQLFSHWCFQRCIALAAKWRAKNWGVLLLLRTVDDLTPEIHVVGVLLRGGGWGGYSWQPYEVQGSRLFNAEC